MPMMEFRNSKGKIIRLDPKLTLAQLVEQGLSVEIRPKEEPPVPGAFYPTDDTMDALLVKRNLIPDGSGVAITPQRSKKDGK